MHIHILGICGTFMAGVAILAKQQGHTVTGSDTGIYPPMSTQLEEQDITCQIGYDIAHLNPKPDYVIIGNALSRGNPAVEYILNQNIPYISGAQWLADYILKDRWVLAVSGTHGKTTTTSMLAWILKDANIDTGFLIGGIAENFGVSAYLGKHPFFVVEADEYDTAFFDKRSKFVHYRPNTLIINNLEFDHADIFKDLAAIQTQFHHLVRTVPSEGLIVHPQQNSIEDTLKQGCWTPCEIMGQNWQVESLNKTCSEFAIYFNGQQQGTVNWSLIGQHNMQNGLAAIAAARHAGVPVDIACDALNRFKNVKRRLELRGSVKNSHVYDDFAHHPTAIATTLHALRDKVGQEKITVVLEPRSNTMKMGIHQTTLADSLKEADEVLLFEPANLNWSLSDAVKQLPHVHIFQQVAHIIDYLVQTTQVPTHILIMSNGGFDNIHQRLLIALETK